MAKIVINKNFQSKYLYRAYERLVKPEYSQLMVNGIYVANGSTSAVNLTRSAYKDLSSGLTNWWAGIQKQDEISLSPSVTSFMVGTETYITVLNKINKALKSNTLPNVPSNKDSGTGLTKTLPPFIMQLMDTLFSSNITYRNNGYKYFYDAGIITQSEYNYILSNSSGIRRISASNVYNTDKTPYVYEPYSATTINSNGLVNVNSNEVLRLDTPLYKTNNTNNEQLYVVIVPFCDVKFSNLMVNGSQVVSIYNATTLTDKGYSVTNASTYVALSQYATFHDKATNTVVNQIPYIALSLTEVGQGGDIEFDHLDEIEYLDEIKISIALPKEYV